MKPLRHELAVIVPAGQRCAGIGPLIDRLERALAGLSWEAVFFADQVDGTVEAVTRAAHGRANLRCLPGAADETLAKLCAEGLLATSSGCIAVMDTDARQDESLLPRMVLLLREARLDAVIGTCSGIPQDDEPTRRRWQARRRIIGVQEGPPSEFFVMRREFLGQTLRNLGGRTVRSFHDLLAAAPGEVRFQIMPFDAPRRRATGRRELAIFAASRRIRMLSPARIGRFGLIGAAALAVHMAMVALMYGVGGLEFLSVQAGAAVTALMFTFMACNRAAPVERQIPNGAVARGAIGFIALCAAGLALNVYAADLVIQRGLPWEVAAVAGAAIGWVWNATVATAFTWRPRGGEDAGEIVVPHRPGAHSGLPVGS